MDIWDVILSGNNEKTLEIMNKLGEKTGESDKEADAVDLEPY